MFAMFRIQGAPFADARPVHGLVAAPNAPVAANDAGPVRYNLLVARRERRNRRDNRNG
jgi:hypothetical protein